MAAPASSTASRPSGPTRDIPLESLDGDAPALDANNNYTCVTHSGVEVIISNTVVARVPYLNKLLVQNQFAACPRDEQGRIMLPQELEAPYLQAALAYVERGDGQSGEAQMLLTKLPREASFVQMLQLLDFLLLPRPSAQPADLNALLPALKDIQDVHDRICRRVWQVCSASNGRVIARNAATTLCVALESGDLDESLADRPIERTKIYQALEFILSHFRCFRRRLRTHTYKLVLHKCRHVFTAKQMDMLAKWDPTSRDREDRGRSNSDTEEEQASTRGWAYDYDSDYD